MKKFRSFPCIGPLQKALYGLAAFAFTLLLLSDSNRMNSVKNKLEHPAVRQRQNPSLRFEQNQGQTDERVDFLCRSHGHILFINAAEAVLKFHLKEDGPGRDVSMRMTLLGADPGARGSGLEPLPSKSNYFIGNDPSAWRTGVPHFAKVRYEDVYEGIDLQYYIHDNIEFDFLIDAGFDPDTIGLAFHGADKMELNEIGDLIVRAGGQKTRFPAPQAYQDIGGERKTVDVRYRVEADKSVHFALGPYEPDAKLVIDPKLVYASYLGGSGNDTGFGIAVDQTGCAYVTGSTSSADFPVKNAHQSGLYPGSTSGDIFITKMNAEGTGIVYSTYLGSKTNENAEAIAVDAKGRACVTGRTNAGYAGPDGFPMKNELQSKTGDGQNAFVSVLDPAGRLTYSTLIGGSQEDYGKDIAVDASGCVAVVGTTFSFAPEFPVKNAYMSQKPSYYFDAFAMKIDPSKSGDASLVYSTYLGGDHDDYGNGVGMDAAGCMYVTGKATANFPVTANAIQPSFKGKGDIFVTKIDPSKSGKASLVYSTYLGNDASNEGLDIEADAKGCAYVCGYGPVDATPGAFSTGGYSFICKLHESGNGFIYSARVNSARRLAVDAKGNVFATFFLSVASGGGVIALNPDGSDTLFTQKTFVTPSAVAVDADGFFYVTGSTNSPDFPTTTGSYRPKPAGSNDAVVAKWPAQEMLVAKVFSDPVEQDAHPVRNTAVDVFSIDLANRAAPLAFLARKTTDGKGVLRFPKGTYQPGMPIFIRTTPERKPSPKMNRTARTGYLYKVHVDNLVIDPNGGVAAQRFESDPEDTTRLTLGHTSVGFSLIASIEWLASPEYVANLQSALRKANNLLYDVTNGQAFIDTVAIFDGGDHWGDADIRMHANNLQWPEAHVYGITRPEDRHLYLPPAFYFAWSDSSYQISEIFNVDQLDPSVDLNVTTLIHEFGHYALGFYDEYRNILGEGIFSNINFGFMDSQFNLNDPFSTEMSDYRPGDARFQDYSITDQFKSRDKNCWDFFKKDYDKTYGDVAAGIHRPHDFGVFPNAVTAGPNSDWNNPDYSVGDMMGFENRAVTTTQPRRAYQFLHPETRLPVAGAMVKLRKQDNWANGGMVHGATTFSGRIKLFNPENGDHIYATHNKADQNWLYIETLVVNALPKAGNDATEIEMKTVRGGITLLSAFGFDASGKPVYQCQADPAFASPPAIQVSDGVSQAEEQVLSQSGGAYSAALSKPDFTEGSVFFSAPDSLGETFFVSQNASIRNISGMGNADYFPGMQAKLNVDFSGTTSEKASLLASGFPAPVKGLPDSVRRVSDVVALNVHPAGSVLKGQIQIHYYADSLVAEVPEAVKLYHWKNGWVPLSTGVDLVHDEVSAALDGAGYYAAFLDLTRSRVVTGASRGSDPKGPTGWMLHPNYPNPFNPSTRFRYDVPILSEVRIEIFDLLGRKVRTLVDGVLSAGTYNASWDGRDDANRPVSAGIYICRMANESALQIRKMALIR